MSPVIRSFIAVDIPDSAKRAVAAVTTPLKTTVKEVKWVEAENFHLTLKFLGNVEAQRLNELYIKLAEALSVQKRFTIRFSSTGTFPEKGGPKVFWLSIGLGESDLAELSRKTEEVSADLGFPRETRPFTAHLTLGRARQGRSVQDKVKVVEALTFKSGSLMDIDHVTIYQSILSPKGPTYQPLYQIPFL